jgi:hypothetical protein
LINTLLENCFVLIEKYFHESHSQAIVKASTVYVIFVITVYLFCVYSVLALEFSISLPAFYPAWYGFTSIKLWMISQCIIYHHQLPCRQTLATIYLHILLSLVIFINSVFSLLRLSSTFYWLSECLDNV